MGEANLRNREVWIIIGLTVLAFMTRGYGLSEWALFGDEIPTVIYAEERATSWVNPAYYVLVLGSFELFGVSEWSARLPSMLLGVVSIPVFYVTWRRVFGNNIAFIGALIIVFSSWHLWQSQFSRFYSGVFLFGSLSFFFYYRAIQLDSMRYLIWAVLTNAIGCLFHVTAVMVVGACGLFSLLVLLWKERSEKGYSKRIAGAYLGLYALLALIALPFLWGIAEHRATSGEAVWGDEPAEMILQLARRTQLPVALTAFFGLILLFQQHLSKAIYLAVGIAVAVSFLLLTSGFMNTHANYVMYVLPLIILLSAFFCHQVGTGLENYRFGYAAMPAVVIVLMLPEFISHYSGKKSLDVREVVSFVNQRYQPGDKVLSFVREFDYYGSDRFSIEPRIAPAHSRGSKWIEPLDAYKDDGERLWVILNTYRKPVAKELDKWLLANGALVWHSYETRLDYIVHGYQVFLIGDGKTDAHVAAPK